MGRGAVGKVPAASARHTALDAELVALRADEHGPPGAAEPAPVVTSWRAGPAAGAAGVLGAGVGASGSWDFC
jgi:hypothetical protein